LEQSSADFLFNAWGVRKRLLACTWYIIFTGSCLSESTTEEIEIMKVAK
jgi:hypothetical protein